jgi:hypothetical protein
MSPSEIVDEMENIFLDNNSDDMDVDKLISYLDYLDQVAPIDEPFNTEESYQKFMEIHAVLMEDDAFSRKEPLRRPIRTVVRRAALVAAMLCLVIGACGVAYASSVPFAQWVNEVFSFADSSNLEYSSLQEALDDYGVKEKLLPKWLPQDYVVADVSVEKMESFTVFSARYESVTDASKSLTVSIRKLPSTEMHTIFEKDDATVDIRTSGSYTYYITHNEAYTSIIWDVTSYECCITGVIDEGDISNIISSIE